MASIWLRQIISPRVRSSALVPSMPMALVMLSVTTPGSVVR